ncbi:response regulator transcription factor [Hazenella sp. IB182357]|uniref:Response regulator transcription factor n=1 Tax=Polycladospora coralii TaxID=2771432 RepID=A0A926N6Z8_9BACL|nr:response regulator transcription factor [Polycladospora coralii]MBD1372926.1 response regulator transcription factor [Polycladospora coralii]
MRQRILLIEDDLDISNMIERFLTKEGYTLVCAYDGETAIEILKKDFFTLLVLDLMLPKMDGITCLKAIRMQSLVPIIILSAKGSDIDKALGLGFGADDYLAKPFSMTELLARVKALIRRASYQKEMSVNSIQIGALSILPDTYSVLKKDQTIQLTLKEFKILYLLAMNGNKIFTKEEIYQRVWKEDYYEDANVINVHISRLREKIEDNPSRPKYVKTIWGIGYRWGSESD